VVTNRRPELTTAAGGRALRHRCHLPVVKRLGAGVTIAAAYAASVDFLRRADFQIAANALKRDGKPLALERYKHSQRLKVNKNGCVNKV